MCKGMVDRLPLLLVKGEKVQMYDYAVVLGGTNDLGYGLSANDIFAGLLKLYTQLEKAGVKHIFAVTIPSSAHEGRFEMLRPNRAAVNGLIKAHVATHSATMSLIDLDEAIKQPVDKGDSRKDYWDDGLHFSAKGYDKFGELVFESLKPKLEKLSIAK